MSGFFGKGGDENINVSVVPVVVHYTPQDTKCHQTSSLSSSHAFSSLSSIHFCTAESEWNA